MPDESLDDTLTDERDPDPYVRMHGAWCKAHARHMGTIAFTVYTFILIHLGDNEDAWPGVKLLSELTGCAPNTVRAAVEKLERLGYISIKLKSRSGGGHPYNSYSVRNVKTPPRNVQEMNIDKKQCSNAEHRSAAGEYRCSGDEDRCSNAEYRCSGDGTKEESSKKNQVRRIKEEDSDNKVAPSTPRPAPAPKEPVEIKTFPAEEPDPSDRLKHLLWRIEAEHKCRLPKSQASKYAKAGSELLDIATEDQIILCYRHCRSESWRKIPYKFEWLPADIMNLLPAARRAVENGCDDTLSLELPGMKAEQDMDLEETARAMMDRWEAKHGPFVVKGT